MTKLVVSSWRAHVDTGSGRHYEFTVNEGDDDIPGDVVPPEVMKAIQEWSAGMPNGPMLLMLWGFSILLLALGVLALIALGMWLL